VNLNGVFPPIPTPFRDDQVDLVALRANLQLWLASGIAGVVALGSNGEAPLLDEVECDRILDAVRAQLPAGRTLVAGTGRESTRATIAATRRAASFGADAVLVRTPSFFKARMTPEALGGHYRAVADASPVPVLLYNYAALTGVNLQPATVGSLAEHPNIIGIKESSGDVGQIADFVAQAPAGFHVLAGSAPTFYPSLCVGASGGILALACVLPEPCVELHRLFLEGRHADALALQQRLTPLARAVTSAHGIAGLKAAMDLAGYAGGHPRPPLRPLEQTARDSLSQLLRPLLAGR
jgi:4-hydroxy-2-oxoglutarate aldolase